MSSKVLVLANKDNVIYNFRRELIFELLTKGYEVILSCPYGKKLDCMIEKGASFKDIEIERRGKNVFKDFKLLLAYNRLLKEVKPDVVLTYTGKPSIYGGFVCGRKKIPYIVNNAGLMETTGVFDKFMKVLYRFGFGKASCIMFQNDQEKEVIEKVLRRRVHSRRIPGSGVNLNEFVFKPFPKDDETITFNYVARIVDIKGIREFLSCAEQIKKEYASTRFVIYGDYDDDKYRMIVQKLEDEGVVEYGGVQLDMKPCIEAAHAVIHPSYYEGMTNVVLEHSAMGRVCIGSDIPGVADGIEEGKTGFLCKVKDAQSLVTSVKKFLALSHEDKEKMGLAARKKMEKEFNRELVTAVYMEEIERICNRGREDGL